MQFCQGAATGKATRINEAKHYQVVEDFWICLACFYPCILMLMWMGSGFGVVVPSSEECTPCKVNEVHMECVELICSLKMH